MAAQIWQEFRFRANQPRRGLQSSRIRVRAKLPASAALPFEEYRELRAGGAELVVLFNTREVSAEDRAVFAARPQPAGRGNLNKRMLFDFVLSLVACVVIYAFYADTTLRALYREQSFALSFAFVAVVLFAMMLIRRRYPKAADDIAGDPPVFEDAALYARAVKRGLMRVMTVEAYAAAEPGRLED